MRVPGDPVPTFDVLGLGYTAVDDLLYVDSYPPADTKARVRRRDRQAGGLSATALVAAARLGARCQYAGVLDTDDLSAFVAERLAAEGIGLDYLHREEGARPVHSVIVVDEGRQTRNIFYDLEGVCGAPADWPADEVIRAARVLFVDHLGLAGTVRAARVALAAGVPVVADFESLPDDPLFGELVSLANHPVASLEFAQRWTGREDPADAVRALWTPSRQAVVVTCGADGCWYLDAACADRPVHQPAFRVDVVDTTGCGDVFHGAYAAGLAEGLDLPARIRLAAATAALKATCRGGQSGIPQRSAVEAFLHQRGA
jgi:sugar/nucleoside kinase (ribokinase family)